MSCLIRSYQSKKLGTGYGDMNVTAYVGDGRAVQFTIGSHYCALSGRAVQDLIETLQRRVSGHVGYTATGEERDDIIFDDGELK
jgi:hypothetical protein